MSARLGPLERAAWQAVLVDAEARQSAYVTPERLQEIAGRLWTTVSALLAAEDAGEESQNIQIADSGISASMPEQSTSLPAFPGVAEVAEFDRLVRRVRPHRCGCGHDHEPDLKPIPGFAFPPPGLAEAIKRHKQQESAPASPTPVGGSRIDGAIVDAPEELQRLVRRYAELWLGWLPDPDSDAQPWDENDLRAIAVRDIEQYVQRREAAAMESLRRDIASAMDNEVMVGNTAVDVRCVALAVVDRYLRSPAHD